METKNLSPEMQKIVNSEEFKENVKILNEKIAKGEVDKDATIIISPDGSTGTAITGTCFRILEKETPNNDLKKIIKETEIEDVSNVQTLYKNI